MKNDRYIVRMIEKSYHILSDEEVAHLKGTPSAFTFTPDPKPEILFTPEQMQKIHTGLKGRAHYPQEMDFFGDKDRLYLQMTKPVTEDTQTRRNVDAWLKARGYHVVDYTEGYATDEKAKQKFRIGKLLANTELQAPFRDDVTRIAKDTLIVISRDAIDIARMSTARNWTSCMDAHKKSEEFNDDISGFIARGGLVAYLIRKNDIDITAPFGRVAVKAYWQKRWGSDYADESDIYAPWYLALDRGRISKYFSKQTERAIHGGKPRKVVYFPDKIYGTGMDAFRQTVADFFNDTVNKDKKGIFKNAAKMIPEDLPFDVRLKPAETIAPVQQLKFLKA